MNIKKISAALLAAAVAVSMTGCGENTTWGADIDGQRIPAGVLIYFLQTSYYDAQSKLYEENAQADADGDMSQTDVYTAQIEGKNGRDWVYDDATEQLQIYAAVESKFDEYGLTLTDEERDAAELYCDQLWDNGGEAYYTSMGISRSSYVSIYLNNEKRSKLFEHLYSEGGEYGVPDSDVKAFLSENYALINYIDMELKDGEGNLLKSDGKAERREMAQSYVERFNAGEDFDGLNAEYVTYYQRLQEEAAQKAAETSGSEGGTAEGIDTDDSGLFGGGMAEVDQSPAQAANGGDGDTIPDDSEEEADTSESEAAATEPLDGETVEGEQTTSPAETEGSETVTSQTETAPSDSTDGQETGSETPDLSNLNMEDLVSVNTVDSNRTIIEAGSSEPNETVNALVFGEMSNGDIEIVETPDGEHYFVVTKIDILEDETYFDAAKTSLLFEMKSEDYDALIDTWTAAQSVSKNEESFERYDPKKMIENS